MLEEIYDIIDTILEYFSEITFSISDRNKKLLRYLTYIYKVLFAIYIFYKAIPNIRQYGITYQSESNGIVKILKGSTKLFFGLSMIYFMLIKTNEKCPPCPTCPTCSPVEVKPVEVKPV